MGRIRRCDARCHKARGPRCKCWCGGYFHGSDGAGHRQALFESTEAELQRTLAEHGFKEMETAFVTRPPLPEADS